MSSSTVFIVLYTHQKTKKSKTWHDGRLKVHQDNTAHLYDDHNGHIDTLYIKPAQVYLGADLESAKYLITVDDNGNGELSKPLAPSAAAGVIKAQCVQHKPAKTFTRTRMGFTVPRQVNTKLENGLKESPVEQSKFSPSITNNSSRQQHCRENRGVITPCNKQFTGSKNSNQQNKTSGILNSYSSEDVCDDRNGVESNSTAKSNICQPSLNQTNTGECQTNSIHAGMKRNRIQILELLGNKRKRFQVPVKQSNEVCSEMQTNPDTVPVIESNANSFNMNLTLNKSLTDELKDFFGDDVEEVFNAIGDNVSGPDSMQETTLQVSPHQNKQTETLHQIHFENKNTCSGNRNKDVVCRNKSTSLELLKSRNFQKPGLSDMKSCLETNNVIRTHDRNKSFQVFSEDQCLPYVNSVLPVPVNNLGSSLHNTQMSIGSKLRFSSKDEVDSAATPTRQTVIPILFEGIQVYKTILASAIKEHLNILMFSLSQQYHQALSKIDISNLTANCDRQTDATAPTCQHNIAAKIVCVKKDGANKGRFFYTCSQPRSSQCKFFLWADQYKPNKVDKDKINSFIPKMSSLMEMRNFMKSVGLSLHCGAKLIRKARGGFSQPNLPPWIKKYRRDMEDGVKKKLFLKLLHKDVSSAYAKDDIWVISGSLQFEPSSSFIAKSVYHGPSSNMELEIEPVTGYSPSNWPSDTSVHGLLLLNASSELAQLYNIDEHISLNSVPVLPYLMDSSYHPDNMKQASGSKAFKSPLCRTPLQHKIPCTSQEIVHLANEFIYNYHLNDDQAEALLQVASMFETTDNSCRQTPPITLIHGVFGAGKSFLLSVVVLFLVKLFAMKPDQVDSCKDSHWRLLISSTTNVAVDRILLGLLELGFEDFIRVGSLRKISKPILPYSVHASDKQNDDIKELQEMLKSDLTSSEKQLIKKSLERQRLGHNKALLAQVKVVAVTCAASVFPCIDKQKFPVVLLDECSQMTEPASLLPVAKFHCEEIVLVGDPKQLPPTIQKSESSTNYGLEQTLFDRLVAMGIEAIMLRTQYRCHPHISALSNHLFYENQLVDGVGTEQRQPLMDLPTLCFYNVHDGQEHCEANGSYYNLQEVTFVAALLQVILQHGVDAVEIGVITLYRAQAFKISEFLKTQTTMKPQDVQRIQISTVDAFQGGEKNVILLSCVRTDYVGFIDSYKRTNVALTRSKYHLFIIGHLRILSQNELWGQVIELCKERPNGIQSAKSFIKEWKDKNIDTSRPRSKKTVLEKKKADEALIEVVDLTELNDSCQKNVVDDQPTTIPIGNSEIPVDSQESLPYSPMDVPSTDDINSSRVTTPNKAFNMASSCPSQETSGLNQDSVKEHTSPFNSTIEEIQIIGSTSSSSSFKPIKETVLVDDLQRREPGTKAADVTTCQEREIQGTAVGEVFHNIDKENAIKSSVTHAKLAGISLSQEQNNLSDIDGYTSPSYSPLEEFEESFSSNNSFAGLEQIMTTMT
ncbi:5'-3' DNA helicase ZGRF1-like [Antedon mediterranea]|uniref:5'-3' DNA helicase ZGRF1-like n=1 Tax=Antedon mediterranea TaxID=105859 RepID=UPI003AF76B19